DRVRRAVERDGAADRAGIGAEAALPETVADDRDGRRLPRFLGAAGAAATGFACASSSGRTPRPSGGSAPSSAKKLAVTICTCTCSDSFPCAEFIWLNEIAAMSLNTAFCARRSLKLRCESGRLPGLR